MGFEPTRPCGLPDFKNEDHEENAMYPHISWIGQSLNDFMVIIIMWNYLAGIVIPSLSKDKVKIGCLSK